jgi:iron complex outermembrane recepter protein
MGTVKYKKIKNINMKRKYFRMNSKVFITACLLGFLPVQSQLTFANGANSALESTPQPVKVTGKVIDANTGEPVIGCSVIIKGTSKATITDANGAFVLDATEGAVLTVSYIGYLKTDVKATAGVMVIKISEDATKLNEVVVTALGIKRENKSLGYSVSTISAPDLVKTGASNFATALYGKASGVRVQAAPGGSTSAVSINVRGLSSITGTNQPLVIVNGVPIRNGDANNKDYWNDQRINSNGLIDINPEDIESLSILKGASASALYGSEAANGVVMITTKSGKATQGLGVDVSANISGDWVAYMPTYQTTYGPGAAIADRGAYETQTGGFWERTYNGKQYKSTRGTTRIFGPQYDGSDVLYYDGTVRKYAPISANPWDQVFRTGANQTYNIGITQGNEKGNMRFAYTYVKNLPTQYNSSYEKHNFNLTGSYSLNKQLKVDYSANYIAQDIKNRPYRISRLTNNFSGMFSAFDDVAYLRDHTMTSLGYMNVDNTQQSLTPNESFAYPLACGSLISEYFWNIFGKEQFESNKRLIASVTPSWKIVKGLTLQGRLSTDYTSEKIENKSRTERPLIFGSYTGAYSLSNKNYQIVYGDVLLMYNGNITEKLSLVANAGWQARSESYYASSVGTNGGLSNENWFNLNASKLTPTASMDEGHFLKQAFLGTASFSWDNFAYLEGTIRSEKTSSLQGGAIVYPSVNSSLIYTEAFRNLLPQWYSYGKMRVSYGKVGNSPQLYAAQESFTQSSASGYIYNQVPSGLGNNYIKPENKYEFEVGLENKFFSNRLGFEATYYTNKVVDQILQQTQANSSGASSMLRNVGELQNHGFEFSVYGTPIQTKKWRWDVKANIAFNRNKITKLSDGSDVLVHTQIDGGAVSIESHVGQPMGDIYAYAPQTDANGNNIVGDNGFYKLTSERVKIANAMPKAIGGFSTSLSYQNLSLDVSLDYRIGGAVVNTPYEYLMGRGSLVESMNYRDAAHGGLNYYYPGNDNTQTLIALGSGSAPAGATVYQNGLILPGLKENGQPNDKMIPADSYYPNTYNWGVGDPVYYSHSIFDNSYVKVREISLSYQMPKKITSKINCKSLTIGVFARNPFYIYKNLPIFDAEATDGTSWISQAQIGGSTATTRTFGATLRASF